MSDSNVPARPASTSTPASSFVQFMGMEVERMQEGVSRLRMPLLPQYLNSSGIVHGGVLASLIDSAAGAAAFSVVPADEYVVTLDLNVSYLRSRKADVLECIGRVTWRGGTLIRVEAEVTADGEATAKGFLSFMVRKRPGAVAS